MINAIKGLIPPRLAMIAAMIIVSGLALDLFFVGPRTRALRKLEMRRSQLVDDVTEVQNSDIKNQKLLQYLEQRGLRLTEGQAQDPTAYLGELIEEHRLLRLELKALETIESTNLVEHRFFVKVSGDFEATLDFVRTIEQATRLAVIDEIKITLATDRKNLEARLNLSIYDPQGSL